MKTNHKRDVQGAFVRLVSHLFLQGGAGSAHIWMRVWDPGCAFLRLSWSQWVSCHYWLPEGGGKKEEGRWLLNLPLCWDRMWWHLIMRSSVRYGGQDSLPVCFGRGFHLAGPCVSLWCACHSLSLECYWRGWCRRRQIGGAISWEWMALMWRGWSRWLEETCQHPDTTQMEISCAATEAKTSLRRGSIFTTYRRMNNNYRRRRQEDYNTLLPWWVLTEGDWRGMGSQKGCHCHWPDCSGRFSHCQNSKTFSEWDIWKNSKHDEI